MKTKSKVILLSLVCLLGFFASLKLAGANGAKIPIAQKSFTYAVQNHATKCSFCNGSGQCTKCSGVGTVTCYNCSGSGVDNHYGYGTPTKCSVCRGTGSLKCSACNGSGECQYCHGTGTR